MWFGLMPGWPVSLVHGPANYPLWPSQWLPAPRRPAADFASSISVIGQPPIERFDQIGGDEVAYPQPLLNAGQDIISGFLYGSPTPTNIAVVRGG
jgi:hypothetical protein